MKKIRMIKTLSAYDNLSGERVMSLYEAGKSYDASESLCADLVGDGVAEIVDDSPKSEAMETKIVTVAETKPAAGGRKQKAK